MRIQANRFSCLRACAAVLLLAAIAAPAAAQTRPGSYAEFDSSIWPEDGAALKDAILGERRDYIYLQAGRYLLDNPVVIDRTTSLFIHGIDRFLVTLIARDPSQPLFLVRNAPLLNFASVRFQPRYADTLNARAVTTANVQPVNVEFQDCVIDGTTLEFAGPGSYRVQSCFLGPGGRVRTPILVDHPGADVLIFGGDGSNGPETLRAGDFAHVWQKRGRLRIHATTFEGGLGPADVRIESGSSLGPHVLASVRSEGANGALNETGAVSRLLYVPPTNDRVDVVLKANGGAWLTGPKTSRDTRVNCKVVSYNGAGTVWLFGNRADFCARHLVEGDAPKATIVSAGNVIASPEAFPVRAAKIISSVDAFTHYLWTGTTVNPWTRWIPDGSAPRKLASYGNVPQPPQDMLPPALGRPFLTAALPGMLDVKKSSFGAKGDGITDDTAAIQRALDAQCDAYTPKLLYFPAGTYRIRNTLYLNHHVGGTCRGRLPAGGWIAGAGSTRTTIAMDAGVKKGVFATDGFAFATVQGITFKTWPWRQGDPKDPNFDLELYPGYVATQQNNFYDVVFDGGYMAFANGVKPPGNGNCSSNAVFGGRMKNAHIGFASGHFNALANLAYDSEFIDNDHALAVATTDPAFPPGGTFYVYRSTSRGSRQIDFQLVGTGTGSTFYAYEWTSDAPSYLKTANTATPYPLMLERSRLTPRPGATYLFDVAAPQGPFFLYSSLTRAGVRVGTAPIGQSYAIKMESDIADWSASVALDPNGQLDEISWASKSSLGPPGRPHLQN